MLFSFFSILKTKLSTVKEKKHVVMYTTVFGKKSHVLHLSQSLESLVFMSPSAHFTLSHEMNVVDTVCQLRVLVN